MFDVLQYRLVKLLGKNFTEMFLNEFFYLSKFCYHLKMFLFSGQHLQSLLKIKIILNYTMASFLTFMQNDSHVVYSNNVTIQVNQTEVSQTDLRVEYNRWFPWRCIFPVRLLVGVHILPQIRYLHFDVIFDRSS